MYEEVINSISNYDIFISAAAISDYRPSNTLNHKHKTEDGELNINLVRGRDILKTAKITNSKVFAVGFSAETKNIRNNAKLKLKEKGIDMIIANEANHQKGLGFESDNNEIIIIDENEIIPVAINTKKELAKVIINKIVSRFKSNILKIKNAR
jgi:phosphopantothenoylcysteine decarboxylase/phosphopantothenate--cysteine ligase